MNAIAQPPASLTRRSIDQLEEDIISLSQHINASEYEFLVLLREFDLRQGWKAYHFNHCAEWLNMKCGMCPRTAREKLRVANALFDLPDISRAFQRGDLSYSKARSLTRAATPATESQLLEFALMANAAHVDRHCTELRNANRATSVMDARRAHAQRYLSYTPNPDGTIQISAELPKEDADLLIKALELASARIKGSDAEYFHDGSGDEGVAGQELSENDGNGPRGPSELQQRQADAVVEMARAYLAGLDTATDQASSTGDSEEDGDSSVTGGESSERSGDRSRKTCTADHYQVTVHVDEKALRGQPDDDSKSDLPIETVRRLCCDGSIVPLVEDGSGKPVGLGRKHRVVNASLKRALLARDKGCRFPGCTHSRWLDAHHVLHWADGGETTAENLVILCSAHHRLLHEGGFEIKPGPGGEWQFRNATGNRHPGA